MRCATKIRRFAKSFRTCSAARRLSKAAARRWCLAGAIQDAMNEKLSPKKTRTALGGDYYILTLGVPSVLVECGFLSNAKEEALLLTEDYRQRVAQAIASGVLAWANLPEEKPQALPAVDRSGEPHAET